VRQADDLVEETAIGELCERVGRRELLIGITVVGGGGTLLFGQSDSNQVGQAEDQLAELASTVDTTDLVDPQQSGPLRTKIANTVASVNKSLTGVSTDNQQTKQQVSALKAATAYYTALKTTLDSALHLQTRVENSETNVINHTGSLDYDPAAKFDTKAFEKSIDELAEIQADTGIGTGQGRKLVPNRSAVIDSLNAQQSVYQLYITAQQLYLDTGDIIEAGVRAHEQAHFEQAQSKLAAAKERLSVEIPPDKHPYQLSFSGLSLGQYATLFVHRDKGVRKLLKASDPSLSAQQRQSPPNDALDHFFEARQVVAR
jgi:hypothetical protein